VRLVENGVVGPPLAGAPDVLDEDGERSGLISAIAHPEFARNGWVYFCHLTGTIEENHSRITRARLTPDGFADPTVVFEGNDVTRLAFHNGCAMTWDPDGRLVATFGGRGFIDEQAQDVSFTTGTVVRIEDDGAVPADNPFHDDAQARPEIWAYGFRDPQGLAVNPATGGLWLTDHGPDGGDELNALKPGGDYGWPTVGYGLDTPGDPVALGEADGVEGPVYVWTPAVAPSDLFFYQGDAFPNWRGDAFVATLRGHQLIRIDLVGERVVAQEPLLLEFDTRLRDATIDADGIIYVLTDGAGGKIVKLAPADENPDE
jgi:glucose/arabinose dehydrogenase